MSLTPNSALGASVPQHAGAGNIPIPFPGVRDATPGHLSHLPPPGHLSQGQPVGALGQVTPAGLSVSPGTPPHPPPASSGAVAANAQSLHATAPSEGDLARSTSNPSLALNPSDTSAGKSASASAAASAPCGACKFLRRKCTTTCIFAQHFLPDQSPRFANVHKIFGASNVAKWLQELPVHSRDDAVNSLCYEADARIKDPVYGCVGALFALQQQVVRLQGESTAAQSELARLRALAASQASNGGGSFSPQMSDHHPSRLPPPPQLAMMPSFVPTSMPPPPALMMNTISGFDTGQLPSALSMTMYNGTQMKAGPGIGASMLSGSTSTANPMTLYSMSGASHGFSSPPLPGPGGFMSAPPALKLSPQNMMALHGVPSTGSTNEHPGSSRAPEAGSLESPGGAFQGSVRSKRLRSEQGSTSSLVEVPPPECNRPPSFAENGLTTQSQPIGVLGPVLHGMPRSINMYPHPPHMEHDLPAGYGHPLPRQLAGLAECHDPNQIVMIPQFQRSMPSVGLQQ